uniref:Uncharacterized protein n=1 Tax=Trichuris muris TaxID=70415 RepID=A0A5S6QRB1_TRIMR
MLGSLRTLAPEGGTAVQLWGDGYNRSMNMESNAHAFDTFEILKDIDRSPSEKQPRKRKAMTPSNAHLTPGAYVPKRQQASGGISSAGKLAVGSSYVRRFDAYRLLNSAFGREAYEPRCKPATSNYLGLAKSKYVLAASIIFACLSISEMQRKTTKGGQARIGQMLFK